jgi:[NiFe] hydrogenase diaphorase moiety large subunit
VVNNVETFMAAAQITLHGSECFQCCGTEFSTGTKLLSISGDCERPGIYEYPFGVSIQQILEDCGANDTQAIQLSGAAGSTIPADDFGHAVSFEDLATGGSFMVFNKQRDLLDMVRNFSHFFAHESCGFCTPCRVGCSLMQDLLDKVDSGHASEYDLEEIRKIAQLMQATSHCGLGTSAPISVLDTLKKFPHIYQQRLKHSSYEPAFDLDAALQDARDITGRNDAGAHIGTES